LLFEAAHGGLVAPAPVVTPDVERRILRDIIHPTIAGMASEGAPFIGFLYAGLMIAKDGSPRVIEFNVRLGDPETQPIMMRLKSDLLDVIDAALDGRLDRISIGWDERPALGVVLAAHGYPGKVRTGDEIHGLDATMMIGAKIFHAGTKVEDGKIVASGGRVLTACALGKTFAAAQVAAYSTASHVHFDGMLYRRDIGYHAVARVN
jgi:phosphoribosylamine--glycine ligase